MVKFETNVFKNKANNQLMIVLSRKKLKSLFLKNIPTKLLVDIRRLKCQ
jgi:hypothetical protein